MSFEARMVVTRPNLAIGLLAAFGCLFLLALRGAYFMTFHMLFTQVANAIDVGIVGRHPLRGVANIFRHADNNVMHWIGEGIDRTGHAAIELMLWVAYQVTMVGVAIAAIGYELALQAAALVERTALPHLRPIVNNITYVTKAAATKAKAIADSRVPALTREIHALEARVARLGHDVALPAPITIPREIPKVGQLEDAWDWTRKHLGTLTKLGTVAGLVGLTAAVLTKLGVGWVRCAKVGRAGRGVCGMNESLLNSLLADALLVVGAISVVEFAKELQAIETATVNAMRGFVREI